MFFNNNKYCCQNNWQQEDSCCDMDRQCGCGPVIEPTIERCVERNICHRVEQPCFLMIYIIGIKVL